MITGFPEKPSLRVFPVSKRAFTVTLRPDLKNVTLKIDSDGALRLISLKITVITA